MSQEKSVDEQERQERIDENSRLRRWVYALISLNLLTVGVVVYEYWAWHEIFKAMS